MRHLHMVRGGLAIGLLGALSLLNGIGPSHASRSTMHRLVSRTIPAAVVSSPPIVRREPRPSATAVLVSLPREIPSALSSAPPATTAAGTLIVRVRPWGTVSIPGVVTSREAPLQLAVSEGDYTIRVRGPQSATLQTRAHITASRTTTCHATTVGQPKIWCR